MYSLIYFIPKVVSQEIYRMHALVYIIWRLAQMVKDVFKNRHI